MDIFTTIQKKVKESDRKTLIKKLGYCSEEKGDYALNELMSHDTLLSWHQRVFYDKKYTSEELVEKLAEIFMLDGDEIKKAYEEVEEYSRELDRCCKSYIFVNTNFRRKGETIVSLALTSGLRYVKFNRNAIVFKKIEEVLDIVRQLIKKHYKESGGKLDMWGIIADYKYHHYDGREYIFDTEGNLLPDKEIFEPKATLEIKGKDITNLIAQ